MSDTGWIVLGILGFVLIIVCYLAFAAWLDAKYPPRMPPRSARVRATPPPMWTSSTTTWTTKQPPPEPEIPEPRKEP